MSKTKPNENPGQPINLTSVMAEAEAWWQEWNQKTAGTELGALHRLLKETATTGYMRGFLAGVKSCEPKSDKNDEQDTPTG